MNIYLLAIAILPVLILAIVVYRQDKFNKEPIGLLFKCFFFGALSILPAALLESVLSQFDPRTPVVSGVYTGFVVARSSTSISTALSTPVLWHWVLPVLRISAISLVRKAS